MRSHHPLATKRMGGSHTQVGRPVQEPGAFEDAPRMATIKEQR